jgi:hypothetical protein
MLMPVQGTLRAMGSQIMTEFVEITGNGVPVGAPATLMYFRCTRTGGGAAAPVILRDNSTNGTDGNSRIQASVAGGQDSDFPLFEGVRFDHNIGVQAPANTTVYLVYGQVGLSGVTVTSCSPASLPRGSNPTNVDVNGTNFEAGATVDFGGGGVKLLGRAQFVNSTMLRVRMRIDRDADNTSRSVTVKNRDGREGSATAFTVT